MIEVIEDRARDGRLHELLQRYHASRSNRVIIFVLYKKEAVRVEQLLQRKGWKVRGRWHVLAGALGAASPEAPLACWLAPVAARRQRQQQSPAAHDTGAALP